MQHTCKLALAQMRMTDSVEENLQNPWSFAMKRRRDHKSRRPGAAGTLRTESRRSTGMAGEGSISGNQKARVVSVILRISLLHVTIKPLIAWRMKQQI